MAIISTRYSSRVSDFLFRNNRRKAVTLFASLALVGGLANGVDRVNKRAKFDVQAISCSANLCDLSGNSPNAESIKLLIKGENVNFFKVPLSIIVPLDSGLKVVSAKVYSADQAEVEISLAFAKPGRWFVDINGMKYDDAIVIGGK